MSDDKDERDEGGEEDATGAGDVERNAKDEIVEALDHFKNAASILFGRAVSDPAVKSATREASRIARKIGDAAEPLAKQLTSELGRLTKDVMETVEGAVEGATQRKPPPRKTSDEEE